MTSDDRARQLHDDLEAALEAVRDHERARARLERAVAAEESAHQAAVAARHALGAEEADVHKLESFSPTRIWATLCGRRDTDLDRERAEQQAAEYAVARAEAWLLGTHQETQRARAELDALGDVAQRRERALAAKEEWLRTAPGPAGAELARIAVELAAVQSELTEVREAGAAADSAAVRLEAAAEQLGSAGGWATYDTFFGGGLLTDAMKYDRMDRAQELLHAADQALRHLAVELQDVGVQATMQGLAVDSLTHAFDVWFDNIFSDWAVRDRIARAGERTADAARTVAEVRERLADQARDLGARSQALRDEREQVLTAARS